MIVVTDVDQNRLARAETIFPPSSAQKDGIELIFVNSRNKEDAPAYLRELTGGAGFDDVFVFTPVQAVVEQGDRILGRDGCLKLTAISEFEEKGKDNPHFARLAEITKGHNGLWCAEAEQYLLKHWLK
jgi:threonine dehydrogenase-like Zn-dependent dehydrogenase